MKETVEHGGGNGAIAVKDCRPLLEGFVGSDDDRALLVALADDLEKQIGPALIYREISDLIEYKDCRSKITFEFGFEDPFGLSGTKGVNDVDSLGDYAGCQGPGVALGSSLAQTWRCPFARAEHRRAWLKRGSLTSTRADRTRSARESLALP
jgi:hypothetical protein